MQSLLFFSRQLLVQLAGVLPVNHENGLGRGVDDVVRLATAANSAHRLNAVVTSGGDRALQSSRASTNLAHRELGFIKSFFRVVGFVVDFAADDFATVAINIEIVGPGETLFELETTMEIGYDGTGVAETDVDDEFLNEGKTGVCDGCTVRAIAGDCISGACDGYDKDASYSNMGASVSSGGCFGEYVDIPHTPYNSI